MDQGGLNLFTSGFWKQAAERAVKSAVQAVIGLGVLDGANVLHFDWKLAALTAGGALLLSLATSVVTSGIGQPGDPSMVKKES